MGTLKVKFGKDPEKTKKIKSNIEAIKELKLPFVRVIEEQNHKYLQVTFMVSSSEKAESYDFKRYSKIAGEIMELCDDYSLR